MAAKNRGDCLVSLSIMRSAGALHLVSSVSAIGMVLCFLKRPWRAAESVPSLP
jgi:hypothetical protein